VKLTDHQRDMVEAIKAAPYDIEFRPQDIRKIYGYPHSDASKILQQDVILLQFVTYAPVPYKKGAIHYMKNKDFDMYYKWIRWFMLDMTVHLR